MNTYYMNQTLSALYYKEENVPLQNDNIQIGYKLMREFVL